MNFNILLKKVLLKIPIINNYINFKRSVTNTVTLKQYIDFKFRKNKRIYWPLHPTSEVTHADNIFVGINTNPGTRPGCYLQGNGGIYIGNYCHFASNIGIISANHDPYDQSKHINKAVHLDNYCWIGQNAMIMPGVKLGPRTIVGAGAVVTRSFPDGYCIIAGNPARLIKKLDPTRFKPTNFGVEYYGFISKKDFPKFAKKNSIIIPEFDN